MASTDKNTDHDNGGPKWKLLVWSFVLGILLFAFMFLWMHVDFLRGEEYGTMGEILHIKHWTEDMMGNRWHKESIKAILDNYLLIDVSKNSKLVYTDDDRTMNEVRVDRRKLAEILRLLYKHKTKIRYVICDINLDRPYRQAYDSIIKAKLNAARTACHTGSDIDSLVRSMLDTVNIDSFLRAGLDSFHQENKVIVPTISDEKSKGAEPCIFPEIPTGLAQYKMFFNGSFYRFNYYENDSPQLPLCVYDQLYNKGVATHSGHLFGIQVLKNPHNHFGYAYQNQTVPFFRVTPEDIKPNEDYYAISELLMAEELIDKGDSPRIVIIGNFENTDVHSTLLQRMAGPLIILNLYEALKAGDNQLSWYFILLSIAIYSLIGYFTLTKTHIKASNSEKKKQRKKKDTKGIAYLSGILVYIYQRIAHLISDERNDFLLLGYTIVALLVFHHYLFFLSSLLLLILIESVIGLYRHFKGD